MQSFEFQADTTVSLVSPAAISRKSCDHCFLNRKTCDKVRESADSGEKCRRCAKDNRPCTFTPTVHLYHIADCVGRHQCRAKVVQAMGGRKKDVQFKTIEIPIVCDMDSAVDLALFDFIQKQPNLLVYNNRIKSFLAQDMLGVSPDYDGNQIPSSSGNQGSPNYPLSTDTIFNGSVHSYPAEQAVGMNGTMQSSYRHRVRTELDRPAAQHVHQHQHQHQQQRSHPYAQHQRSNSDDRSRHAQRSPRVHPASTAGLSNTAGRQSPSVNVNTNMFSPVDQRRHSDLISPAMSGLGAMFQQQQHPYAQQSPYPQALQFQPSQSQPIANTQYRTESPFPPSPVALSPINSNGSPHCPSPLELAIGLSGNFRGHGSQQGLAGLFDTTLTMSTSAPQSFHQRNQNISSSSNSTSLASPSMASDSGSDDRSPSATPESQPLVITTVNEDGNEVGVYYAVPQVNLNPAYQDADLFQDFTMMDSVGEDFVWIQNLFEDDDQSGAMSTTATSFGDDNVKKEIDASPMINGFNASNMSSAIPETASMADFMLSPPAHGQQGQEWACQYQTSFSIGGGHSALTPQG